MATIREYFDADFNYAVRVHVSIPLSGSSSIEASILCDFSGYKSFLALYIPGEGVTLDYFLRVLKKLEYGRTQLMFEGRITLPAARFFHGEMQVKNENPFTVLVRFFDDSAWISISSLEASRRIFIYAETQLTENEMLQLKTEGKNLGHEVQFRSKRHAGKRVVLERPLAFISHDSRDKQEVARKIAIHLQRLMCPVWYDEFSLSVGNNLRESIEKGLKECHRCILILSPNFIANKGWTKKEFESIFTREILEQSQLVLPVWYGVNSRDVYEYSPALLNIKGLDWNQLGENETCRLLCRAITQN